LTPNTPSTSRAVVWEPLTPATPLAARIVTTYSRASRNRHRARQPSVDSVASTESGDLPTALEVLQRPPPPALVPEAAIREVCTQA
jgi:hypothetical protein